MQVSGKSIQAKRTPEAEAKVGTCSGHPGCSGGGKGRVGGNEVRGIVSP